MNRLLDEPIEEQSPGSRFPPVEVEVGPHEDGSRVVEGRV
jgi:hypothetical protein